MNYFLENAVTVEHLVTTETERITTEVKQWRNDDRNCDVFIFVVFRVILPPICILGVIGNMLSLVVFSSVNAHPTIFLLKSLALSDTSFLITSLLSRSMDQFSLWYKCKVVEIFGNYIFPFGGPLALTMISWITCLITFFRFYIVCYPFNAYKLPNLQGTRFIVLIFFVMAALMEIPRFFEQEMFHYHDVNLNATCFYSNYTLLYQNKWYQIFYRNMFVLGISLILPIVWCVVLTGKLVLTILRTTSERKQLLAKSKMYDLQESYITRVSVLVVMIYIVCQLPSAIYAIMRNVMTIDYEHACSSYLYTVYIGELMLVVNSAVNFIVYALTTPRFRRKLKTVCLTRCDMPHRKIRHPPEGKLSSSSDDASRQPYAIQVVGNRRYKDCSEGAEENQCTHL